jgi:PAS domain S-box-containing protein
MTNKIKIISAFCLSIAVLVLIGLYAYKTTNDYKNASDWTNHTLQVIAEAQEVLLKVKDIETAQRGYVITNEEKYLEPYERSVNSIENVYFKLRSLIRDNAKQLVILDSIHTLINLKIVFAKNVISVRKNKDFKTSQELVATDVGENLMKQIRELTDVFISNEKKLFSERLNIAQEHFYAAKNIIVASIILTILMIIITLYFFINDFNKRMLSEKQLQESESRIKKILDSFPLGVFVLGINGKPYYTNNKSQDILGRGTIYEASSTDLPEIYKTYIAGTDELYPSDKLPIVRAINGEKNICVEDLEILKKGKRVPLRVNATYITNSKDEVEYAIAVFEDITDIKEAEQKLIEAKKLAEQSGILKEAFLANMSHEIRTPMNAIMGFTDLLLNRNLQTEEKDFVQTIKTSGENLLRIINDVLDVSKIESGTMTFEEHPMSIKELFPSLSSMLIHKAKEKNLELSFEYDHNIPETVLGDPTRLTQIIINLVGNAIKFTQKGSVTVSANVLKEEKESCLIEFSVKDTGIGISDDKLQHIFERFRQAESHTTRYYGGTGLGLSIAKQLVELQNGEITVKSLVGVGSVFSFTLNFKKTDKIYNPHPAKNQELNIYELSKKNILLVEDNPINIKFVLSLFADYNMKADIAENGKQALEKIKTKLYDIVLMDIEMPEMNGYETTKVIRNEFKNNVPIIAMTANAMAGEREKCLQIGMNDYISKPIKAELLFEKMFNEVIVNHHKDVDEEKKIVRLDFLIKSMRGKKEVIRDTIDIFLKQVPEDLAVINEAVSNSDFSAIKKSAHRMKSTVSIMGISEMEAILEEMEVLAADKKEIEKLIALNDSLNLFNQQALRELQIEKLKYL